MFNIEKKHRHFIARAEINKPPLEDDCEMICQWMADLIADLGMKILAEPRARYCADPDNRGLTADALLTTSHCVAHVWDFDCGRGVMQFDLYTCSDLDETAMIAALDRFEPTKIEWKYLDRANSLLLAKSS